jgi:quercetin dioxygenase-like cupin family protein
MPIAGRGPSQKRWQTQAMRYTRIFNGSDGASRLEGGEVAFASEVFAPPAPPLDVSRAVAVQTMLIIRFPSGWSDAAHPSPARQWMFVLSGHGEVTASGETKQWGPGDAFLVEDTSPPGHATTVHDEAVLAVVRL